MLRGLLKAQIRAFVGGNGKPPVQFLTPPGDPGLFGPHSVTWKIHADFMSMMIGGLSSLMLQALHPLALAAVWDHSNFRTDLRGRLNRTAYFIAASTYGGTDLAESAIARVRDIHSKVSGHHPDGRAYTASDPHLLYWVHLIETTSFLNAYRRHVDPNITQEESDRYFEEMSLIAEKLGVDISGTPLGRIACKETEALEDIKAYLPELVFSDRAQSVLDLLKAFPSPPSVKPLASLMIRAGLTNLPPWAYAMIGERTPSALEREAINTAVDLMARPVRWALNDGVAAHAKRRMGISVN